MGGYRWCSAVNCSNNSGQKTVKRSFFHFPKDAERCKQWVIACRRKDLDKRDAEDLNKSCTLCSDHFEDEMFMNDLKNRLQPYAVPSKFSFPNPPASLKMKIKGPRKREFTRSEIARLLVRTAKKCSYHGCKNTTVTSGKCLFHFPKDEQRSNVWIFNARRNDLLFKDPIQVCRECILCQDHFEDGQFFDATEKKRLVWNAIPTLFGRSCSSKAVKVLPQSSSVSQEKQNSDIHSVDHNDYCSPLPPNKKSDLSLNCSSVLPVNLCIKPSKHLTGGYGVWTLEDIPVGISFGPHEETWSCLNNANRLLLKGENNAKEGKSEMALSWFRYIRYTCIMEEQNLIAVPNESAVYYLICKPVPANMELLLLKGGGQHDDIKECHVTSTKTAEQMKKEESTIIDCDIEHKFKENHNKQQCVLPGGKINKDAINANALNSNTQKTVSVHRTVVGVKSECETVHQKPIPSLYYLLLELPPTSCKTTGSISSSKQMSLGSIEANEANGNNNAGAAISENHSTCKKVELMLQVITADNTQKACEENLEADLNPGTKNLGGLKEAIEHPQLCNFCGKNFKNKSGLVRHKGTYTRPYKCKMHKSNLKVHETTHIDKKPYECIVCRKNFRRKYNLILHQRIHTEVGHYKCDGACYNLQKHKSIHSEKKLYLCHFCGKMFAWYGKLRIHEMTHVNDKSKKQYECSVCGKRLSSEYHLFLHKRIHAVCDPHTCTICGKKFQQKKNLKQHKVIHSDERPYLCHVCGKRFTHINNLKRHEMVHARQKYYECTVEGKIIRNSLPMYERMHNNAWPYKCNSCGKRYTQKSDLKRHQVTHTGEKPYLCQVCGKNFALYPAFKAHQRIHTGEKPYLCNICGKSFLQRGGLQVHEKHHTGERPYLCHVCGKTFLQRADLMIHQRTHTGEKPYQCDECSKRFVQRAALKQHMKVHMRKK